MLLLWSIFSKNGLEEATMILCASIVWPSSHANVTSEKSLSFRNLPKAELTFSLKSFYCRQSFSDIIIGGTFETVEKVCTKNRMMIMKLKYLGTETTPPARS